MVDRRGKIVSGIEFPAGSIFGNANLLTAHMFHALAWSQSMQDLKVTPSKGNTIAKILEAEFPALRGDGGRCDKLVSFKTLTYVQANLFLCAPHHSPGDRLFERARTFQDSLVNGYNEERKPILGIMDPAYRNDLQKVLAEYYEELMDLPGASGVSKPRALKYRRSVDPVPPPPLPLPPALEEELAPGAEAPVPAPGAAAGADPPPAPEPERAAPSPAKAKGRKATK